jgi:mannose-6-phosphate isomerase-like protein (cupin superfamily)
MAQLEKKSFDHPDETRPVDKGTVEIVELDGATVMRTTFQPGWRWSECVKPVVGGDSCQTHHVGYVISGRMHVVMNDGSELELGPGEAIQIPPGHDAWIVGDDPYVGLDFKGGATYAKG